MDRRGFLAAVGGLAAFEARPTSAADRPVYLRSTSSRPPRKVIVGTVMQPFWGEHPGLRTRLEQLTHLVDQMVEQTKMKYGRRLDLAILPETSVTGEAGSDALACSVPLEGLVQDVFSRKAREHGCYVIVATYLLESKKKKGCSNAAILFGRTGELVGIYRKMHLVVSSDRRTMEGGSTPGDTIPVFDCDFGKLGMQICYDMEFDYGWAELSSQGAELIAWPTQSPQTAHPAFRAMQRRCYIVSSTWRNNASIFEPTGKIAAQIRPPDNVLVHELDLSYAILPWSSKLQKGEALRKIYGEGVGFRYYEDEDCGLFWSNDPATTVRDMVCSIGVQEVEEEMASVRQSYKKAGLPG